jgi:tetratricopeptide (TPR) repeat protein
MRRGVYCFLLLTASIQLLGQDSSSNSASKPSSSAAQNSSSNSAQDKNSDQNGAPPAPNSSQPQADSKTPHTSTMEPPRSDRVRVDELGPAVGQSSSKDNDVDLSAPANDAKNHPKSSSAVADAEAAALTPGGISEVRAWDPHKAAKDVEVGDFYFKRGNYRAAEDRYREALHYKDNDAIATFRLAQCLEKMGVIDDSLAEYESYLKILPHGPEAAQAQKAITRLKSQTIGK